jgi:hypothetical protein
MPWQPLATRYIDCITLYNLYIFNLTVTGVSITTIRLYHLSAYHDVYNLRFVI